MSWEQMGRSRGCREAQRGPKGGCSLGLATCHGESNWVGWWPQGNGSLGPGRAPFSPSDQVGTVGRDDRIGGKRPSGATQACTAGGWWCDSGVAHILEVAPRRSTRGCEDSRAWGLGRATLSWAPAGFGQPRRGSRERVLGSNLSQKARTKGLRACRLNLPRDRRAEGRRRSGRIPVGSEGNDLRHQEQAQDHVHCICKRCSCARLQGCNRCCVNPGSANSGQVQEQFRSSTASIPVKYWASSGHVLDQF